MGDLTQPTKRRGFSIDDDLMPLMRGKAMLPNFEELPLDHGIATIAAGGCLLAQPGVMNAKIPGSTSSWGHWARYFLATTQGGLFDGTGYVIWYASEGGHGKGHVGRFAICDHKKEGTGSVEQSRRGYSPGFCTKCGLDLTVDSSD